MTHPNNIAYQQFSRLFIEANEGGNKSKQLLTSEAMDYWKTYIKKSSKDPIDQNALDHKIGLLKDKIETRMRRNSIQFAFLRQRLTSESPSYKSKSVPAKLSSVFEEKSERVEQVETVVGIESDDNKDAESNKSAVGDSTISINEEAVLDLVSGEDLDEVNNNRDVGDDQTFVEDGLEQQRNVVKAAIPATPKQDSLQDSINSVNNQILQLQETSRLSILDDDIR